jgi:ADP-heptose:LPS heptosyltransferase
MKISVSSPDGLGDFVLRIPFFEALSQAGHELQVFMRPPAFELATALLPQVRVEMIGDDPYARLVRFRRNPFRSELRKISAFGPDLLVIALFQHSFFDEICISKLPRNLKVAGFRCMERFWGTQANTAPQEVADCLTIWAEVKTSWPEVEKNRLLASAILGSPVPPKPAKISPPASALSAARGVLQAHGLEEGKYWVVCAGSRPGLEVKDWGERNWASALSRIAVETEGAFAFLGNEAEAASIDRIRAALPESCLHFNLARHPPPILTTLGIIALSAGFVGRDSGPMHLAAACARPFVAISSGWLWGRFFPETQGSVIVSRSVPCQGCLGYCHLPEPFCVRRVSVEQFLEGWRLLQSGDLHSTTILEIPLDAALRDEIAATAHLRFPELAHEARRRIFESGRAINLLDSAGMGTRLIARRGYRRRFSRE